MPQFTTDAIPYREFRSINLLRRLHGEEHERQMRGLVVFGDLIQTGETFDINLLEIVAGWSGPQHVQFESSAELPLRGHLNIYFLTPEEFQISANNSPTQTQDFAVELLNAVREAYVILLEKPANYVRTVLAAHPGLASPTPPGDTEKHPHEFFARYAAIRSS